MRVGKVPHVRRIFNLPAEKFDIRPVSLGLDYPNDFTVPESHLVEEAKRIKTRPTFPSSCSAFSSVNIKILCLLYTSFI